MQIEDRTSFGIGLGYMLGELKFNIYVSKDSQAKVGYRVRRSITWRKKPSLHILPCVQQVLDVARIQYMDAWQQSSDFMKFYHLIPTLNKEYPIINSFADSVGYHMWSFVYDNPPPTGSLIYEEFLSWAEAYDSEYESVSQESMD